MRRTGTFLLLTMTNLSAAAEFVVTTTLDAPDTVPGDGVCIDAGGACSLRAAVQEANASAGADAIRLAAGEYRLTLAGTLEDAAASGDLDVTGPVEITGAGAGRTIVDGNALDAVFEFHASAGAAGLRGLGVRGGLWMAACSQAACRGAGGIVNRSGVALRLRDVDVRENRTSGGLDASAILNRGCLDATRVRVIANEGIGPGDALAPVATIGSAGAPACLRFDQAEFSENAAWHAGAIYADDAAVELRRSLIADNHANHAGALLANLRNDVLIENVTITGNEGGAGAILNDGWSSLRIRHATITGNSGGGSGGIHDVHGGFGQVELANTLLAGNHAPNPGNADCNGFLVSLGGVLVGTDVDPGPLPGSGCHVQPGPADQYGLDAESGPLLDHGGFTRSILPVAAAVDAGVATECAATDQRGWPRPAGAACDVGAIELGAVADPIFADGFDPDPLAAFSGRWPGAAGAAHRDARPAR